MSNLELVSFDTKKISLIKNTLANHLNENQFELFISVAKARGLDPILGQIHAIPRDGKLTFQVAIDGFRLIAARTGEYAGRDETVFEYSADDNKNPKKATVTVYRLVGGQRCAWTASARWSEYYPSEDKKAFMWKKLPETMLEKCAESKALRMAFPNDLSGLYVHEEMDQAESKQQAEGSRDVSPTGTSPFDEMRDEHEEIAHDPGLYVMPFGKHKGKQLKNIGAHELDNYARWIMDKAKESGEEIKPMTQAALDHIEVYLKHYEVKR